MKKTVGVGFYGKVRIPTIGHKAVIDTAKNIASKVGGQLHIGLSGSSHPLSASQKKAHAEALFQHPVETHHSHVIEFLNNMNKAHDDFTLVCGSDRAREYRQILTRYNGNKDRSGNVPFSFRKWRVHEIAGKRTESLKNPSKMSQDELVKTVSASKLENLAKSGNFDHFRAYHPGMPEKHVKRLFDQIRRGLALNETKKWEMDDLVDNFSQFVCTKLGISSKPIIKREVDNDRSFGGYQPGSKTIHLVTKNRHPMDVFRTLAHELVHHKQNEEGRITDAAKEGQTGSPIEDEANSMAGRIMRWWAKANPGHFALGSLTENVAIFIVGGPCSGKDRIAKELKEEIGFQEIDVQSLSKEKEVSNSIIVNGSANNLQEIVDAKKLLESNGYETSLLFINTTNEISKLRNEQRKDKGQRVLAEEVRFAKYEQSQQNKEKLAKLFGENMKEIKNNINKRTSRSGKIVATEYSDGKVYFTQMGNDLWSIYPKPNGAGREIKGDFRTLRLARQWWDKNKNVKLKEEVKFDTRIGKGNKPSDREWGKTSTTRIYQNDTPGQSSKDIAKWAPTLAKEYIEINPTLNTIAGSVGQAPEKIGTKVMKKKRPQDSQNDFSTEGEGVGATTGGHGKVQKPYGLAEWANSGKTIARFEKKYGTFAQQKLAETVKKLRECVPERSSYTPKTLKQIRESIDKGALDAGGTVPATASPDRDRDLPPEGRYVPTEATTKTKSPRSKKHK